MNSTVLGRVEIGWRIRSDLWRRGYAFEAAQAVLEFGHNQFAEPIVSRVAPSNWPSRGLMEKLGMKRAPELDYVDPRDHMPLMVYEL